MTAMAELAGNTALHGAAEPEKPEAVADETSLIEAFELTLDISQDVELPECAASEETDSREQQEDGQQDDRQQEDGQTSPPVPESGSKWVVGAQCRAVWSEDGRAYPATVASLDGERCRVRFDGYGNEEDVELSALRSPDASLQTQRQNSQDWKPGSRCRAVYSEDGLVYPAVVLWVKGQRCGVRFDNYNNEEEQDVGSLLNPDELRGPSRAAAAKGSSRTSSVTSSEENQRERGAARRSAWRDDEHNSSWGPVSFIPPPPPPPPLWTFGGKESGSSPAINATSSMLMLWYMCGFHTGSFMSQRGLWDELGRSSFLFHSALLHLFEYF
ncbi:survival motor neuron protein-like isoform X4 [Siniperca chuatsi]|uniref:survival motor neuron protein-like isoform X4 n=1 Tax=Siniperca chuatsi TaxID=119488 RepID=UPI001CE20C7A|nr:survival motor neuron protein-like isoform X4 [Siniperca chuatsi]